MKFNEYQEMTNQTAGEHENEIMELLNWSLGVAGEGGEIADYTKKVVFHGHKLDSEKLIKECGDVLWYIARLSKLLGYTLEQVATLNIIKLKERYPKGFDSLDSIRRVDEKW